VADREGQKTCITLKKGLQLKQTAGKESVEVGRKGTGILILNQRNSVAGLKRGWINKEERKLYWGFRRPRREEFNKNYQNRKKEGGRVGRQLRGKGIIKIWVTACLKEKEGDREGDNLCERAKNKGGGSASQGEEEKKHLYRSA